ncbi:MAG: DNA primase [Thermodesulfovibrionales bacterium]|nr:DNA primase [Thermodesulfovibrionales bacterium]
MNSIIEEIKSRLDIVDLVSETIALKKAGQNYKGLCPFHSEKTPSFTVNPSKQIFHCFGCNKGGDMFTFIMDHENMTFQEAVSYLANKAGISIEGRISHGIGKGLKESLFNIYKETLYFFQSNLKNSKALTYLKNRGLADDTIEKFSLGYSKKEKNALFAYLKGHGFSDEHLKTSRLFNFSAADGAAYDFFRDRLMFPIFDLQGRVIAFGGRALTATANIPKYINSPESAIFKKGDSIYGINMAKNYITQKGYSIIVEGYLDVIMCHQYGFHNTVAPLGTALTAGQLRKLKRFSDKVLLIFDGDTAGISATKRSVELCYAEGMPAKIVLLPSGDDPDTLLRKHGAEHLKQYIGRAITPLEFILKAMSRSKLDAVRYSLQLISSCHDSLQRDDALRELSDRSKINELTLREELKAISNRKTEVLMRDSRNHRPNNIDTLVQSGNKEEKILLNIALSSLEKAALIVRLLDPEAIENNIIRGIFEKIKTYIADGHEHLTAEDLLSGCDNEEQKIITMLSINTEIDKEYIDKNIEDCLKKITLKNLEKRLKEAERNGDAKLLHSLLTERKRISQKTFISDF